jgi:uncharacterized membrane protein
MRGNQDVLTRTNQWLRGLLGSLIHDNKINAIIMCTVYKLQILFYDAEIVTEKNQVLNSVLICALVGELVVETTFSSCQYLY